MAIAAGFDPSTLLLLAGPMLVVAAAAIAAIVTARRVLRPGGSRGIGATVAWLIVAVVAFGIGCCYGTMRLGDAGGAW